MFYHVVYKTDTLTTVISVVAERYIIKDGIIRFQTGRETVISIDSASVVKVLERATKNERFKVSYKNKAWQSNS